MSLLHEYDRLVRERIALRKFQTECFGPGGRVKYIENDATREQAAVAEAIRRALSAIKNAAPAIAAHLRSNIRSSGNTWTYSGGLVWDTTHDDEALEKYISNLPDVPVDADRIRRRWLASYGEPTPGPIQRRTRMQGAKTQLEKLQVISTIDTWQRWWLGCRFA